MVSTTITGDPAIMWCRFTTETIITTEIIFAAVTIVRLLKGAAAGVLTDQHLLPGRSRPFLQARVPAARDHDRPLQGDNTHST